LIVENDSATFRLLIQILRSEPALFAPVGAAGAEEALRLLESGETIDCLLTDVALPDMDGLELLRVARERRPGLKVIVIAASPTDDLYRAALDLGAAKLLPKPLDFEEVLASLKAGRTGSLSHLSGALDLVEICQLSSACQAEAGLRVRQGRGEGVLAYRGTTLLHASTGSLEGTAAWQSLRGWRHWYFESLPVRSARNLPENCQLDLQREAPCQDVRASGCLRGLTLRHLIEWAVRDRLTCDLTVTAQNGIGTLSFEAGKIRSAKTAGGDGGRAAAEILGWEDLRVELVRAPAPAQEPAAIGGDFQMLIDRFSSEIDGFIATGVARRRDGSWVGGRSADPLFDASKAAGCYAKVVESHLTAVEQLGAGSAWGGTEDILITTARAYLLIRLLGDSHYHWLAVSSDGNPALCRLYMRSHEEAILARLAESGEIPAGG
jgi:CheY-like chemotaxis protein